MKITNRHGLPQPLVNAVTRDTYSRGASRKSVTQLIDSPKVHALRRQHEAEIEVDVADRMWALMGRAIHEILDRGADEEHVAEERLFLEVEGWTVSGAVDLQKLVDGTVRISDYKFTSAYNVMAEKADWVRQLNLYAHLIERVRGHKVSDLEIIAIVRDWTRHRTSDEDYPQAPVERVRIPLWSFEERESYLIDRVRLHQEAEIAMAMGDPMPACSDEERWLKPTLYAATKHNAKRANRVFTDETEALDYAAGKGLMVEKRPGRAVRCESYCPVARFCDQHKA